MLNLRSLACVCILLSMFVFSAVPGYGSDVKKPGTVETILEDFSLIKGCLVQPAGSEYIIDLDASDNISSGDLFTICSPGETITHPETGEVLGTLEKVSAILSVTRIESKFSFARLVSATKKPVRGDKIYRFKKIKALFLDYTGQNRDLFTRLRTSLHNLTWVPYDTALNFTKTSLKSLPEQFQEALVFMVKDQMIEVRGPGFERLHVYPVTSGAVSPSRQTQAQSFTAASDRSEPPAASPLSMPADVSVEKPEDARGKKVEFKELFPELTTMGQFSSPTVMADFINTDKGKIMASTNGESITTYRINNTSEKIHTREMDHPGQILSLGWWQPEQKKGDYLTVNIWYNKSLWGYIYQWKDNALVPFQIRIPRILGTFDTNADGRCETLLAQEFDPNEIFGSRIWQGSLSQNNIRWETPFLKLPRQFNVAGSCFGDVTGDGKPETIFILNEKLFIYSDKKPLFKSSVQVGGSHSILVYDMDNSSQNLMSNSAVFEIRPQVRNIDGKEGNEIIVPSSDKGMLGSMASGIASSGQSLLFVFKYKADRLIQGTLGDKVSGSIQGLD
ncbi:MAG: hypothetical protein R6U68_11890, partial [Desulfobacteraceae bacterium]